MSFKNMDLSWPPQGEGTLIIVNGNHFVTFKNHSLISQMINRTGDTRIFSKLKYFIK